MSKSGSLQSPRSAPHLRLNSGRGDLDDQDPADAANSNKPLGPRAAQPRSLIPPSLRSGPAIRPAIDSPGLDSPGAAESAELLLPPTRSKTHRFRDDDPSSRGSPNPSGFSSRRTSWSSEAGSRDSRGFGANPFEDSRAPSRSGSDDENVNTQTVSEKYNILPSAGLLLFPEDVEKDDWLHNPDPNEKPIRECDIFTRRGFMNIGGLSLITLGLLILFIGYPILTFVRKYTNPPDPCASNPDCIHVGKVPLLKNLRSSLIDPDTPSSAMSKKSVNGKQLKLVFSDEFNTDGRSFYPGDDPYFNAVDLWYGVTQDMEWYDPDAVTTANGALELKFEAFQSHGLNYRSGMLQSWNQMCFQGGHLEAAISLPGRGDTSGFWPGFWAMGNLGRPGYASTTDGMWPYSYDNVCDAGITANQSMQDGTSELPGMRLPACTCANEDHPTPGISRSAPEIDVIEASVGTLDAAGNQVGVVSQSAQIAPFDIWYAPDYNFIEIYNNKITTMNAYRGGPFQEAMSALSTTNNQWYNGNAYQTYAFEYTPGPQGAIDWFVGPNPTWKLDARALRPNGNVGQRIVPNEPMALVMNFGMSDTFAPLNFTGLAPLLPARMRFDYVRIYQDPNSESVSCDPPGMESTDYIATHMDSYANPNKTRWFQTSHDWPKNALVDGCKAADSSVTVKKPS